MVYSQGVFSFSLRQLRRKPSSLFIKLVDLESMIMYSHRVASFLICLGSLCSYSLVSIAKLWLLCVIIPDRDHCKLENLMIFVSLFHCVSIMEATCMFYLITSPMMNLGFCIMVALQILLVGIIKRHEIRKILKGMFDREKKTYVYVWFGRLWIMDNLIFDD